MFASHIYDLGNTEDAKPIKQRMRRTPVQFAAREEKELSKMMEACVVQPSISEWASGPVLVRKRYGTVRFCIDYHTQGGEVIGQLQVNGNVRHLRRCTLEDTSLALKKNTGCINMSTQQ